MAPHDGAGVCCVIRGVWRAQLDRAAADAPPRAQWRAHMNWRIQLTWWDKTLQAIVAVAAIIGFVRFATGIGTVANINNAYPWGGGVGYGIRRRMAMGGAGFPITGLLEI